MEYTIVESALKTKLSRKQLWKRIDSPLKIAKIEGFKNPIITKLSDNNYELVSAKYHVIITFIPEKAVNLTFIGKRNFPLTWFEIKGTASKNCTIAHGEYKRIDKSMSKAKWKKEIGWIEEHFIEELKEIIG